MINTQLQAATAIGNHVGRTDRANGHRISTYETSAHAKPACVHGFVIASNHNLAKRGWALFETKLYC